ncbi:GntR family transcriptional regulator [Kineococcus sp. TRM81007]|uniref:GntR family transcriptional regulator n=1 Tax=Kineococcus sp. TRM81007 TaxID=2925831 RepID=UPI001F57148B|nr:GntR family transcriptional regulator [Kineococcus sp. TRM81007]MCI2238385.1 GntR family transcriptional regulator [Kineococcus sp. TRM81007]
MSLEQLSSLDRSTLRERALAVLRSAITSGRYRPGDHLGEVDLSQQLGISRGTVREALRHLEQEGLVAAGVRGMLRVRVLSVREVGELFRVRAALEGQAVAEIAARPDRDAAVVLLREALDRIAAAGDFEARLRADLGFHLQLCELSGNSMLVESWRHLEGRMQVTIMSLDPGTWGAMTSEDRHLPIVEALARGDVQTAVAVVREHMAAAAEQYAAAHAA